jgi:cytochrome o ubiquinol oxidase subunit II
LDPQGPIASAQRLVLINSTAIMLVVVVPVIVATLAFAWWYRSSNTHAIRSPDESYEGRVEFVVWSIPTLTVILLGGVIWIGSHQLDPRAPIAAKSDPLRVDVVSLDWKWLFIYPDLGVAAVNQLVIPAGLRRFRLTSATVMNSFFVPQVGSQIYTMAGNDHAPQPLADKPGEYPGFSANFRRRLFRMRSSSSRCRPAISTLARAGARHRIRPRRCQLRRAGKAEPSRAAHNLSLGEPKLFERILDRRTKRSGNAVAPRQAGG